MNTYAYRARIPTTGGAIGWTGPWRDSEAKARSDIEPGIPHAIDTTPHADVPVIAGWGPFGLPPSVTDADYQRLPDEAP